MMDGDWMTTAGDNYNLTTGLGDEAEGTNSWPLVYLPAVLAQVARLKRGKKKRREERSS